MKLDASVSAVVTGGASGLGAATARALAARGVRVAVFDMDAAKGEAVAGEVGGVFAQVDVTDDASVAAGFAAARAVHGPERVLVCCAGIAPGAKTVGRDKATGGLKPHAMSLFQKVIDVNLVGSFRCVAKSAEAMVALEPGEDGERGAIVCTASVAAQDGQIGQAAYAASKAGVLGLTLPVARDLMGDGVRINTILPGIFETPMMAGMPQNVQDSLAASVPFPKRLGRATEYADLALFLLEQRYMNGAAVRLDGAIRLAPR